MRQTSIPHAFAKKNGVRTSRAAAKIYLLLLLLAVCGAFPAPASVLPTGFVESRLAAGLDPTSLEVAPDGRIFITEKNGRIRIIKNGVLLSTPFLTLSVDNFDERGLQNMVFDPNFASNGYVYVLYTVGGLNQNRVSRFTANGDVAASNSELVLLNLGANSGTVHNGGGMFFQGGKLFITTGEGGNYNLPQSMTSLLGKILRINPDGTIPTDNPFYTSTSGVYRAIWARGLRNPFKATVQRSTGRIFFNDVGTSSAEEINEAIAGRNYGYPMVEGYRTATQYVPANYADPFFAYGRTDGCAITGGAFYSPANVQFPSGYVGKYFYADYCNGYIRTIDPVTKARGAFATGITRPVDIKIGPDGSMYYLTRGGTSSNTSTSNGEVWRVSYTSTQAPFISAQPAGQTVSAGGSATFTVSASGSTPMGYQWQRNGVNISGANSASYTIQSASLTDNGAIFRVIVSNNYGLATSNGATLTVLNNTLPVATITSPALNSLYSGGDVITFSGAGTDPEDGTLPASAFSWRIDFHHDDHYHPAMDLTSGITGGTYKVGTTGEVSANVWYRIYLTVKDSKGQTHTTYREVFPRKSTVTLATNPAGLQLMIDGRIERSPYTFVGVAGIERSVGVVSPQTLNGITYQFSNWSDGGAASHNITTPLTNTTYTATFTTTSSGLRTPENPANAVSGLNYQYYQGIWDDLPAFNNLSPAATGTVSNFVLTNRLRNDFYGFRFTGFVNVPTDGTYTFYTSSDDGSQLFIGNTLVVDNGGKHGPWEKSGNIGLKAGKHAVTVTYFDHAGSVDVLDVRYAGPGIAKQAIPASALFRAGSGTTPTPFSVTLEAENAVRSGVVVDNLHSGYTGTGFGDYINTTADYVEWTANVPAAGTYTLAFRYALGSTSTRSLAVRVNGTTVQSGLTFPITNGWTTWNTVSITANLQAGANTIRATATGTSGPNMDHLRVSSGSGARVAGDGFSLESLAAGVQLYPMPVQDELTVLTPDAATAQVRITGAQGISFKPSITERKSDRILLNVGGLKNGFYLLTLQTEDGQVTKPVIVQR